MAVNNPWSAPFWNITAQGDYIKKFGMSVAQRTASKAGVKIGDLKPFSAAPAPIERHWILSKKIVEGNGAGSGSGNALVAGLVTKV